MYAGDLVLFLPGLIFLLHPRIPPFSIVISAPRQQPRIPGCTVSNLSSTKQKGHSFSLVILFRAVLHYYVQQRDGGSSTETHCERCPFVLSPKIWYSETVISFMLVLFVPLSTSHWSDL